MNSQMLTRLCVENGLLVFSPEDRPFPGRKGGPPSEVLMDVRGASSNVPLRGVLLGALANELSRFPLDAVIGGVSRGGYVFGSMLAVVAGRPFAGVLPDGHRASGLQRAVEGMVVNRRVVLVDNVVTCGGSLLEAAGHVAAVGGTVVGGLVIGFYEAPPSLPFPVIGLFTLADLVNAAHEVGLLNTARRNRILKNQNEKNS